MLKKKSLGQHFLHSPHYLSAMVVAADIQEGEEVLEVGPGDGALTAALLKCGAHVTAIEKDSRLIPILKEKFARHIYDRTLSLYEGDALEFDISHLKRKKYKIVANIPYYITGVLLKQFFSEKNPPSTMVLLVQKEVAERIARSKKESILSLSVKAYGVPRYVKTVPRGAFSPPPTVDSAILRIEDISRKNFATRREEQKFFELVKKGFAQKRKLLKRNLEPIFGKESAEILKNADIVENARAEDVSLSQWLIVSKEH